MKKKYHTFGTVPKSNRKSLTGAKSILLTHKYFFCTWSLTFLALYRNVNNKWQSKMFDGSKPPVLVKWCDHVSVFHIRVTCKCQPSQSKTGEEVFEDTKGVIRIRKSKMAKRKSTNGQTTICKTLHRKLKIEQHELH